MNCEQRGCNKDFVCSLFIRKVHFMANWFITLVVLEGVLR